MCKVDCIIDEMSVVAIFVGFAGISLDGMKEATSERLAQLLPSNSTKMVNVLQHNEDGTYSIDIPDVREALISEGIVMAK